MQREREVAVVELPEALGHAPWRVRPRKTHLKKERLLGGAQPFDGRIGECVIVVGLVLVVGRAPVDSSMLAGLSCKTKVDHSGESRAFGAARRLLGRASPGSP